MLKFFLPILFLVSCTSLPFPKSNVSNEQILALKIGQASKEVIANLGSPVHWENFDDGSVRHIYTNDWQDGAQIFCRNLAIAYGADDKLAKHWFTNEVSDPQQRCNHYSEYSSQQSAAWSSFAASASQSIQDSYDTSGSDSAGKSCYGDYSCGTGQVCAKKKNGYGHLESQGVCIEMRYYEND
jgi:hypothetical protein